MLPFTEIENTGGGQIEVDRARSNSLPLKVEFEMPLKPATNSMSKGQLRM